jgi:hypothetical protein
VNLLRKRAPQRRRVVSGLLWRAACDGTAMSCVDSKKDIRDREGARPTNSGGRRTVDQAHTLASMSMIDI